MNLIAWLVVGHLVGDFFLQNDWMAKGKKTGFFAVPGLIHFLIYTASVLTGLFLGITSRLSWGMVALVALVVFLSHWVIDATNLVSYWVRFYKQTENPLVCLMVDQTVHVLILTAITVWVSNY